MKTFYLFIVFFLSFCFCNTALAQLGGKIIKQPPRINGVVKATNSATAKIKIHANSNTIVGTNKTHPNYSKKQKKQAEVKDEKEMEAVVASKKARKRK